MLSTGINDFSQTLKDILAKHALKPGQVALFRRLQPATTLDAKNSEDQRFTLDRLPAAYRLLRTETIIDPGTNQPITIANLKGWRPALVAGQPLEPNIGELVFKGSEDGQIPVPSSDPVLYARLLLSDYNKDSPNPARREPAIGYLYELVKPDAEAKAKLAARFAVKEAVAAVEELTHDELLSASPKLQLPVEINRRALSDEELMLGLVNLAETAPERVMAVLDAGERKLEKLIAQAVAADLLDFQTEPQQWVWKKSQEKITAAVQGYKPEEALVSYIQNDPNGVAFSQLLVNQLAQAKKEKPKK